MTTIQDCDIRLVLGRIRNGADYGWRGNASLGQTLEAVDWRDLVQTIPTDAEVILDWEAYIVEQQEIATLRQTILTNAQSAVGKSLAALTAAERNALLAILLYKAGGVNPQTGTVNALNTWVTN